MSDSKKPKLSEIRAEAYLSPIHVPYLLDLVERMGSTLEHAIKCGYFPLMLAQEASALLKEVKK